MGVMSKKDNYVRVCKTDKYYVPISEYNTSRHECDTTYYISIIDTVLESICSSLGINDTNMLLSFYVLPSRGKQTQHY